MKTELLNTVIFILSIWTIGLLFMAYILRQAMKPEKVKKHVN